MQQMSGIGGASARFKAEVCVPEGDYLLVRRGFHWIHEHPYNR